MDKLFLRARESDHSPCVGHCTLDSQYLCQLCRRHRDEVAVWRDGAEAMRQAVWHRLPSAIDQAGVRVMRLPLNPQDIAELAMGSLNKGGAWAVGGGEHWIYAQKVQTNKDGILKATSKSSSITLDLSGKMRALAWARGARNFTDNLAELPILIVVPSVRVEGEPLEILKNEDEVIFKTLLAEGRIKNTFPPKGRVPPTPRDLTLPESYSLCAVILPKGEPPL